MGRPVVKPSTPRRGRDPLLRITLLVLLSMAALVAFGLLQLWGATRAARDLARSESQRAALATARSVRAALARAELLDELAEEHRFELYEGGLRVPPEVEWIEEPPRAEPELEVAWQALREVARAHELEHVGGDPAAAREAFAAILQDTSLDDRSRTWVQLAAAWAAVRAERWKEADALLTSLEKHLGAMFPQVLAGTLLLHARRRGALPSWTDAYIGTLPATMRSALFARLEDSLEPTELARWSMLAVAIDRERDVLRRVAALVPVLAATSVPMQQALEDLVLLYHPGEGGSGRGVLLSPHVLREHLPERESLLAGTALPPEAIPAGPLLGVLPASIDAPAWSEPWMLTALLVVLSASVFVGVFLSLRAIRKEAHAAASHAEFLTSVTHQLRTPLSSIRLLAEMLRDHRVDSPEKREEYYRLLAGESQRLGYQVENVLDLRRLERGERAYDLQVHDLDAIVQEAVELFEPLAREASMKVRFASAGGGARVRGDRTALHQSLLNLMDNARKYAASGGSLEIATARENGVARIRLRDRGPGVSMEEYEAIFERFRRGRSQAAGEVPGVGLGLYLARAILRDHGGDVVCRPREDGVSGACFEVTLPCVEGEAT